MLDSLKYRQCKKCVLGGLKCDKDKCNHYYTYQSIITRKGDLYAVEILSRPISTALSIEKYFNELDVEDGINLINHQLKSFLQCISQLHIGTKRLFINIERYLLIEQDIVDFMTDCSNEFKMRGWDVVFEITERTYCLSTDVDASFYRMILNDITFAADDYSSRQQTHKFIYDYNYVKIEMEEIKRRINTDYNIFIDELYLMNNQGIKLIAEKVQSKNDFLSVRSMPFDYFQGFYFDEKV